MYMYVYIRVHLHRRLAKRRTLAHCPQGVLQCVALQSVEVCLSVLLSKYDYVFRPYIVASQSDPALARCAQGVLLLQSVAECCRVLQSVVCCSVLQSVAVCCML